MANRVVLGVVVGAGLFNAAYGADLGSKWFWTGFHNRDIIAPEGDLKQCELREKRDTPIRSQAVQECTEGSETRAWSPERTVKPHERTAPKGDEIVRAAWLNVQRRGIKSLRDNNLTTIQNRSGELADNVTNNNALLRRLKERGNVRPVGGGNVILEEIAYTDTTTQNVNSYSGYEVINIAPNSPISAAQFSFTQYAAAVSMSGLESLQNSSKEQIIDLLDGRMMVAEAQLANRIGGDVYGDGTGNASKNITGLKLAVAQSPTSGTYGGIDRATWSFWQNVSYSGVTNGGAAVSAANIVQYLTALTIQLVRGTDKTDLVVMGNNYFQFLVNAMQAIQRVQSEGSSSTGPGFASLKFYGGGASADVVLDGGVGSSGYDSGTGNTNLAYCLNTKYIFFRPHRDRNFVPIGGERQSVNQDAIVKLIGWAGNMTSSGPKFQGVLKA